MLNTPTRKGPGWFDHWREVVETGRFNQQRTL